MLIDSGSTHNFISEKIARSLHLAFKSTPAFEVKVANRKCIICQGKYERVILLIQGITFIVTLHSLPLHGLNLVLGIH
jgi:hypothetical protein